MAQLWSAPVYIQAMSLSLPAAVDHPNRMPFSGILTRIDEASDSAPNGSGGKRILITRAAAEGALNSLLGMGVGLKRGMDGHNPQNKVGLITGARIDGTAIHIEGFIYAADFPAEALRIRRDQAGLGFSFEAQRLQVEDPTADPLVITGYLFTGAAILLKRTAAYLTTKIAAASADKAAQSLPSGFERELHRRLEAAGISRFDDGGTRLSVAQLDTLLAPCRNTAERIGLKRLVASVGAYPRLLPV